MLAEAIKTLLELRRPDTVEVNGLQYFTDPEGGAGILAKPPLPIAIALTTLTGFVDAVKAGIDGLSSVSVAVHVENYKTVKLVGVRSNDYGDRQTFITAIHQSYGDFPFGVYMDPESFIIKLQSGFIANENMNRLMMLVSSLTVANQVQTQDDGVTQTVTVKKGAVARGTATVNPRWPLVARRTFVEADQPETEFLLRMKGEDGSLPQIALHEVDGGAWKNAAMLSVSSFLRGQLPEFIHLA